jgi:hypothetical protein
VHRLDHGLTELAAQVAHVHVDEVRSRVEVHVPGHGQQLLPGENLTGVGDEGLQQGEFAGGQAHRPAVDRHLAFQQVNADAADLDEHVRRATGVGPQVRPDASQQFLEGERLGQVIVRAKVEPCYPVVHPSPRAQHQDRNRGAPPAQPLEHLKAVQVGQAKVEDHQRDAGARGALERLLPALHPLHAVSMGAEPLDEKRGDALFVLND